MINKKAQAGIILLIIVYLFVAILAYVFIVPVMMEFTGIYTGFLGFLLQAIPAFLFLGAVFATAKGE